MLRKHWFGFRGSCICITEHFCPSNGDLVTPTGRPRATLFFIHGRTGDSSIWLPLISTFRRHFRCINLDLPGFGSSYYISDERAFSLDDNVDLVERVVDYFLDHGDTEGLPVVLIGHDIGGAIGQSCALNQQRHVAALVLISSPSIARLPDPLSSPYGFAGTRAKIIRALLESNLSLFEIKSLFEGAWRSRTQRKNFTRALYALEATWPGTEARQAWGALLSSLRCPTLLLGGGKDRLTAPSHLHDLMRRLPDAYLFVDEGSSHWPCLENTPWVVQKMGEFLFRLPLSEKGMAPRKWKSA